MLHLSSRIVHGATLAALMTLLAACGGGGGGGSSGGGGSTGTGLVPAAPPTGATLYARAADLRPLQDGATWIYRSADRLNGLYRETIVRQAAGAGGRMVETDSSDPGATVTVGVDTSGAVLFSTRLELGSGLPTLAVDGVELPSPIRVGAQAVLLDRRLDNVAVDFDGDSRADRVDVAMWRVVIGNEELLPPGRGVPLTALRVDTVAAVRVTYSGGSPPATETNRLRTWYAEGIGIVRNAVESGNASPVFESEDWLLGFDGIDRGWGWMRRDTPTLPGGSPVPQPSSAVATSDGILAASGAILLELDRNGRLRNSHTLVDRDNNPLTITRLVRLGAGVRAVSVGGSQVQTTPLAEDGRQLSAPTQASLGAGTPPGWSIDVMVGPDAADGANRAWAAWIRREILGSATQIALRAIDASGDLATPELSFATTAPVVVETLQLAPRVGGTVLQWLERAGDGNMSQRLVFVDDSGTVTVDRRIELGIDASGFTPLIRPVSDAGDLWWLWLDRTPTLDTARPHALRVDAETGLALSEPIDRSVMIAAEIAPIDDDLVPGFSSQVRARNGRWFATGSGFGLLYQDGDGSTGSWLTFAELDPGAGAPAGGATREVVKAKIPLASAFLPASPVVFDDRVIILAVDNGQLRPVVVWRR